MAIDPATRANLELTRTLAGERRGSLLDAIDRTVTAAGSRLLAQRLAAPLTDNAAITRRLDAVAVFTSRQRGARRHRHILRAAPDMSRALARLSVGRGGPRDLAGLRDGILAADRALVLLGACGSAEEIATAMQALRQPSRELARELDRALAEQLPLMKREGGFVRESYEPALDEARKLRDDSRLVVAAMQARYAEETGVKALKIRHNNVLGYFVEVTALHGDKLMTAPLNATSSTARRWPVRCASPHRSSVRSRPGSPMRVTARWVSSLRFSTGLPRSLARPAMTYGPPRTPSRNWTSRRRWRSLRSTRITLDRKSTLRSASPSRAAGIRWWNRR